MEATLGSLVSTPTILTLEKLIKTSEPLIVGNVNDEVRLSACRLVAALINKLPEGKDNAHLALMLIIPLISLFPQRTRVGSYS